MLSTILAAGEGQNFWDLNAVAPLRAILAALGALAAMIGVFKALGSFASGKIAPGVKTLGATIVLCVFLFYPAILTEIINLVSNLVESVIGGGNELIEAPGTTVPAPGQN